MFGWKPIDYVTRWRPCNRQFHLQLVEVSSRAFDHHYRITKLDRASTTIVASVYKSSSLSKSSNLCGS